MMNIPTELLRTFVAVVDSESFTKAAHMLGVTQPAVSAQIKRLQGLLGADLFDKRGQGVGLTKLGTDIVISARRLLSLNDQILHMAEARPSGDVIRIGMNTEFLNPYFPQALGKFREDSNLCFRVFAGNNNGLLRDLREGNLDLAFLIFPNKAGHDARHRWMEEMVWARGDRPVLRPDAPVPIVSRGEEWGHHRDAITALEKAGRAYEVVFTAPSALSVSIAVKAGLGVSAMLRSRMLASGLRQCDEEVLPQLPDIVCAIYAGEIGDTKLLGDMADAICDALRRPIDSRAASPELAG
jgi:DNA-binding transcriptional LysR family regulator